MRDAKTLPHYPLVNHRRWNQKLAAIARWTLYAAGAVAALSGLAVWPAGVDEVVGLHSASGWLVILSLLTLAVTARRAGVERGTMWWAVGWGVLTALGAAAQHQLAAGSAITALHVVAGLGAIGFGQYLWVLMREAALEGSETAAGTQMAIEDAAAEFLAHERIAVTGVSRKPAQHGSNIVYRRLRERGYQVFAINPHAKKLEGDVCFPDLKSVPGGVDAVVIATHRSRAIATMRECAALGIPYVWMHRSVGLGSVSAEAAAWGRDHGLHVIAGGCPLMFAPVADTGHKIMRSLFTLTGKVPRRAWAGPSQPVERIDSSASNG